MTTTIPAASGPISGPAPAIEIHDLVKTFGATRALDGLTLTVPTGQIHGFLGPNGSGKSTTIRVLLGLLRADSGTARLLGGDPWAEAPTLHRRLAYVPGDVGLWPNLTGGEAIDLLGRARGGLDPHRRDDLIERFALDPTKKGRSYSKGNRQKVALVAALASDVELLLLDEPTSGLDPLMERVFTEHLRAERAHGRTVLLSSHILSEVEALCDHVSIVRAGRIVESGTLAQLRHLTRTQVVATLAVDAEPLARELEAMGGVHDLHVESLAAPPTAGPSTAGPSTRLTGQVDGPALAPLLGRLSAAGVSSLVCTPPTLEELFLRHYDDDRTDDDRTDDDRTETDRTETDRTEGTDRTERSTEHIDRAPHRDGVDRS